MLQEDIVRIEDLPYFFSPPMQFTFTQSASLTVGIYPFTGAAVEVGNNKNLTDNTLLYIKAVSFAADIPVLDYQQAIKLAAGTTDVPRFSMFLQSESRAPIFVDPIQLGDYIDDQEYKLLKMTKQDPDYLTAFFRGTLQQTAALAGIIEINLTMNVWVQAITDDNFIHGLRLKYPKIGA